MDNVEKSLQWLETTGLKDSTEALIVAAQEWVLTSSAIYHTRQNPRCRQQRGLRDRPGQSSRVEDAGGYGIWVAKSKVKVGDTAKGSGE